MKAALGSSGGADEDGGVDTPGSENGSKGLIISSGSAEKIM
jgi:hypothetical protein